MGQKALALALALSLYGGAAPAIILGEVTHTAETLFTVDGNTVRNPQDSASAVSPTDPSRFPREVDARFYGDGTFGRVTIAPNGEFLHQGQIRLNFTTSNRFSLVTRSEIAQTGIVNDDAAPLAMRFNWIVNGGGLFSSPRSFRDNLGFSFQIESTIRDANGDPSFEVSESGFAAIYADTHLFSSNAGEAGFSSYRREVSYLPGDAIPIDDQYPVVADPFQYRYIDPATGGERPHPGGYLETDALLIPFQAKLIDLGVIPAGGSADIIFRTRLWHELYPGGAAGQSRYEFADPLAPGFGDGPRLLDLSFTPVATPAPVPLPASGALLVTGLATIAATRRAVRRRSRLAASRPAAQ